MYIVNIFYTIFKGHILVRLAQILNPSRIVRLSLERAMREGFPLYVYATSSCYPNKFAADSIRIKHKDEIEIKST